MLPPPAIHPWRNWYHCTGNTLGTWLPGDPRGFRTRHHHHHVQGDYRFPPPPGYYDDLFARSRHLMPRDAVFIPRDLRGVVRDHFVQSLQHYHVEVVALSVGGVHFHLLARFVPVDVDPYAHLAALNLKLTHARKPTPSGGGVQLHAYDHDPAPRRILGLTRAFVTHELKKKGHFAQVAGGLWAQRPRCQPVSNRRHQLAVAGYIRNHCEQGSAVFP
jgi:hypothetical protein